MEANIINVGNSKGIIIPAKILKLLRIEEKVQLIIEDDQMIIIPLGSNLRAHWIEQFKNADSMAVDAALTPDVFEDDYFDEWTW